MMALARLLTLATLFATLFGFILTDHAGATVGTSPKSAEQLADESFQRCQDYGGTPSIHFDLDSDGDVMSITVTCKGGIGPFSCSFSQQEGYTLVICALMPGQQSTGPNAPIGGGTLTTSGATPAQPRVTVGAFQATTAQDDEDDRP